MSDQVRYQKLLGSHIGFLERSSRDYDAGHEDESLRQATSIRLVFHDTRSSTSLLTDLDLKNTSMLSSSRGHNDVVDYLAQVIDLTSPSPVAAKPLLGNSFTPVSLTQWWDGEPVFVHDGVNYTRKKIILSVANKDGGAHVDAVLESYYEVLCAGRYAKALAITGNLTYDGPPPFPQGVTIYPDNAHLALVRQFAHETVASLVVRLRIDLVEGGAAALDLGDDVGGGGFPDKGLGVGVPMLGPGGDGRAKIGDAGEGATA